MENSLKLRIILENPPPGIDFALQDGKGNQYKVVQHQKSGAENPSFSFNILWKNAQESEPDFAGSFVQGTRNNRFIYIGIGTYAGQSSSAWSRRLKVPLTGITPDLARKVMENGDLVLETRVPGTGKDGGPNCATVKPFGGWQPAKKEH